jgi:hypothetical protein
VVHGTDALCSLAESTGRFVLSLPCRSSLSLGSYTQCGCGTPHMPWQWNVKCGSAMRLFFSSVRPAPYRLPLHHPSSESLPNHQHHHHGGTLYQLISLGKRVKEKARSCSHRLPQHLHHRRNPRLSRHRIHRSRDPMHRRCLQSRSYR